MMENRLCGAKKKNESNPTVYISFVCSLMLSPEKTECILRKLRVFCVLPQSPQIVNYILFSILLFVDTKLCCFNKQLENS